MDSNIEPVHFNKKKMSNDITKYMNHLPECEIICPDCNGIGIYFDDEHWYKCGSCNEIHQINNKFCTCGLDEAKKRVERCQTLIDLYKEVCRMAGVPELITDYPELIKGVPPTEEDIQWAKNIINSLKK